MGRRPLIAGNWKMNGLSADGLALARALAARMSAGEAPPCDVLVCPPATVLAAVRGAVGPSIAVGGQDCHAAESGAHTGDIAAAMLRDAGCDFVIVGHSERRADHGESDAIVRAKAAAAHHAGLVAIICVGESAAERDSGQAVGTVIRQLAESLPESATPDNTVIAYEPVWAIGTGRSANPEEVAAMHGHIRAWLAGHGGAGARTRILYGGSVKPGNAAALLALDDIDGALVGGASLDAEDFWAIVESCPGGGA